MENYCYICQKKITEKNSSREHIIPNSCGGRLKSTKLLCNICNNSFGDDCDAILSKETNTIMSLLFIKKERSEVPSIKGILQSTGEEYTVTSQGKPELRKPTINFSEEVDINSKKRIIVNGKLRNEKDLMKLADGLAKKYPNFNKSNFISSSKTHQEKLSEPLTFNIQFYEKKFLRAIAKIAVNFFIYKDGSREHIKHLIPFLKGEDVNQRDVVFLDYPYHIDSTSITISHNLVIIGNQKEHILYAWVELFNLFSYIVILNEDYDGEDINEKYSFDLNKACEIKSTNNNIIYTRKILESLKYPVSKNTLDELKKRINRILHLKADYDNKIISLQKGILDILNADGINIDKEEILLIAQEIMIDAIRGKSVDYQKLKKQIIQKIKN